MKILVLEDDKWYNKLIVHSINQNPSHEVVSFYTGKEMLSNFRQTMPDIVTLDYKLPDIKCEDILQEIKSISPDTEIIIISEQADIEVAVNLLKLGASDYLVKSRQVHQQIFHTISKIEQHKGLKNRITSLEKEVSKKYDFELDLIGQSESMKSVYELIHKSLNSSINVFLTGETGTGKEIIAKTIHYNSNQKDGLFVAVNLGAIPRELVESELFGHEKGAFTGAIQQRIGKFEEANGGTLFLDEIGEMDQNSQAKLLRVLQEREIVKVGGNKTVKINCRIIVATHKDLKEEMKKGRFREDLFYRIMGIPIHLPPLRERNNDILLLTQYFKTNFEKENKLNPKLISVVAKNKLLNYFWPGNIRELKSVIELAIVMSNSDEITEHDITFTSNDNSLPNVLSENLSMRDYMIRIVEIYMEKFENNTRKVADELQIGQTTVYRLLKEAKK